MKVELTIEEIRRVVTMYVGAETIRYSDGLPLLWKIAYHNITGQADAIQMRVVSQFEFSIF